MDYKISVQNPLSHLVNIQITTQTEGPKTFFVLPDWRPGRYELANYAMNVRDVEVKSKKGEVFKLYKQNKNTWVVEASAGSDLNFSYNYYACKMDAGNSWVDDSLIYINWTNCLMFVKGHEQRPSTLNFQLPDKYQVACSMQRQGDLFVAKDYYELADSPLLAAKRLDHWSYTLEGTEFHLWLHGCHNLKKEKVLEDFKAFTNVQMGLFGGFPAKEYHFIFLLLPYRHYHGVEHAGSTVITLGPAEKVSTELYQDFLHICSHELFHAWNVCRIKPKEFCPYDFSKETYFETGFMLEGITSYYGDLMLIRSGVISERNHLSMLSGSLQRHINNLGHEHMSLTEASRDLWVDGYRTGAPCRTVSIYVKGALVVFLLDLTIRKHTNNTHSLDSLMLELWEKFGQTGKGYTMNDLKNILKKLTNEEITEQFFNDHIYGTKLLEPELSSLLGHIGCSLKKLRNINLREGIIGFLTKTENGKEVISCIAKGSPAEKHLATEDEVIELTGLEDPNNPTVVVHVVRNGQKKFVSIYKEENKYFPVYHIERLGDATTDQLKAFNLWTENGKALISGMYTRSEIVPA